MREYDPQLHPETIKMAECIRAITSAGSVHPVDVEFFTPIQCRKRHKNRRCKGMIKVTRRTDVIEWQCARCEASGIITGWRGSDCDLSKYAVTGTGMLVLHILGEEYEALRKVITLSSEEDAIIAGAVWTGDEVLLTGTYGAFDELAGNVAFEVNHSRGTKQLVLNDLCEEIEMLLQRSKRTLN